LPARPGSRARSSDQQFCPAARTLDLVGERWTLLIVRDLITGPKRWSELRALLPGLAGNLLAERLRSLEAAGLVEHGADPAAPSRKSYALTERGRELDDVVMALARFGLPYLDAPTDEEPLLPHLRDESLRVAVRAEALPASGCTIAFHLDEGDYRLDVAPLDDDAGRPRPPSARIGLTKDPDPAAAPVDAEVRSSLPVVLWVRRGDLGWDDAVASGDLAVTGDTALVRRVVGDGVARGRGAVRRV
ncbi:MAG: helix-turn-helix domain-containing protein, partial [Actinomycetota bacterium]